MKNISNQCPWFVKHTTAQLRSETFSLHNHSVKETELGSQVHFEYSPNFSHVDKVSQTNPELTNQLLWLIFYFPFQNKKKIKYNPKNTQGT